MLKFQFQLNLTLFNKLENYLKKERNNISKYF